MFKPQNLRPLTQCRLHLSENRCAIKFEAYSSGGTRLGPYMFLCLMSGVGL